MACRMICQKRKYDHITPDLIQLHWLKPPERIIFKVAMLVFSCYHGTAPQYLQDIVIKSHGRALRSSTKAQLPVDRASLTQVHKSSFTSMGPRIWNELPEAVRKTEKKDLFKTQLKTYLFKSSYSIK